MYYILQYALYSYILYIYAINKCIEVVYKLRLKLRFDHTFKNVIA